MNLVILYLQALHLIALAQCFYPMRTDVLALSGVTCLALYSFLIHRESLREPLGISPFLLYLFLGWVRLGLIPLYAVAAIYTGHAEVLKCVGVHDVTEHFIVAQFINALGDWFFIAGYLLYRKCAAPPKPLEFRRAAVRPEVLIKSALVLLLVVYASRLADGAGAQLSRLGFAYNFLTGSGASAAILCLAFAIGKTPAARRAPLVVFTAVVFVLELQLALSSYMKQDAIACVLPIFIWCAASLRRPGRARPRIRYRRLAVAAFASVIFVMVLFTYSQLRRADFWESPGVVRAERPEVTSYLVDATKYSIPGTEKFREIHRFPDRGAWLFFVRNFFLDNVAWSYTYIQQNGTSHGQYLKEIPVTLIPRVLWPEKFKASRGAEIAVLLGQASSLETATTATGFTMAGCLYWAWGYPSLVLGMLLNGLAFALVWRIFSPAIATNPIAALICISLFVKGARWFEGAFDGNAVYYIMILGLFWPLSRIYAALSRRPAPAQPPADLANNVSTG